MQINRYLDIHNNCTLYLLLANFLHIFYPELALKTAYKMFYSRMGQLTSVGNYWNDPYHQSLYFEHNRFLPYLNNEVQDFYRESFKDGIVKLDKMVLIGGPDDGIIEPWQSRYFIFFNFFIHYFL